MWLLRALLEHPWRVLDPNKADIFFVPIYLFLSYHVLERMARRSRTRGQWTRPSRTLPGGALTSSGLAGRTISLYVHVEVCQGVQPPPHDGFEAGVSWHLRVRQLLVQLGLSGA